MERTLTIAELAAACGVGVETIRYYQRRGLLETPRREAGAIRRYSGSHAGRLRFIRRAQATGFSLEDVAQLLRLERTRDCGVAQRLAAGKLAEVEARIADLERMRRSLLGMLEACAKRRDPRTCPIVESLANVAA